MKCMRCMPIRMPILTSWPLTRPSGRDHSGSRRSQPERSAERAADALRLPDWDAKIANLSVVSVVAWRCAACCWKNLTCSARRTDQPPGCGIRSVAGTLLHDFEGTVVAITHDRYFLDKSQAGSSNLTAVKVFRGKVTILLAGTERSASGAGSFTRSGRRKSIEKELEWVRQGTKGRHQKVKHVWRALKNSTAPNIRT